MASYSCTYSTTGTTTADFAWNTWTTGTNYDDTSSSASNFYYTDAVWDSWITIDSGTTITITGGSSEKPSQTERFRRALRYGKESLERKQSAAQYKAVRNAAEKKAQELLGDLIGDEQLEVYRKTGRVLVHGRNFDWIINREGYLNKIEKGKIVDICAHVSRRSKYPDTDNVVAVMLSLWADDEYIDRVGNRNGSRVLDAPPEAAVANARQ